MLKDSNTDQSKPTFKLQVIPVSNFNDYVRQLIPYVQQKPNIYGNYIARSLAARRKIRPTRPPDLAFVPRPQEPPVTDIAAHNAWVLAVQQFDFEQRQREVDHSERMKQFLLEDRAFNQGNTALHGTIMSTCAPTSESRLRLNPNFNQLYDDEDGLELFFLAETVCGPAASRSRAADINVETSRLRLLKQKPREPIEEYAYRYRKQLEIVKTVHHELSDFTQVSDFLATVDTPFQLAITQHATDGSSWYPATFEEAVDFLVDWEHTQAGIVGLLKPTRGGDIASVAQTPRPRYGPCNMCAARGLPSAHTPDNTHCPLRRGPPPPIPAVAIPVAARANRPPARPQPQRAPVRGGRNVPRRHHRASLAITDVEITGSGMTGTGSTGRDVIMFSFLSSDDSDEYSINSFGVSSKYSELFDQRLDDTYFSSNEVSDTSSNDTSIVLHAKSSNPYDALTVDDVDTSVPGNSDYVELVLDSGANVSVVNDMSLLSQVSHVTSPRIIQGIGNTRVRATHIGDLFPFDSNSIRSRQSKFTISLTCSCKWIFYGAFYRT